MNRRNFLLTAGAMGTMITHGNISFADDIEDKDQNAVIFLFLGGGASHIETFNPIPEAPSDRRSVTGAVTTNVPGMQLGGLFKDLAKIGHKISIVRSFAHRDANHASATHWVMTGKDNFGNGETQKWPSLGSMTAGVFGTNSERNGIPTYIKMNSIQHDDAAWMGGRYTGYDATQEGRKDLKLGVEEERFKYRLSALKGIEEKFHGNESMLGKQWADLRLQAIDVLLGEASLAFKVEQDAEYEAYKENGFGVDLLTAVRLVETGSKFVTIQYGGWDMHNNIADALEGRQVMLDKYISMLIQTLESRGLSKKVMFVVTSEFGRTPKVNANGGRDHWAQLAPLMIACDSYEMGRVIGMSDKNAETVEENPYNPMDLRWTIGSHLGMEKRTTWTGIDGRPMRFFEVEDKHILET